MRLLIFSIFFLTFTFNVNAQKIAIFKFAYVFENSEDYQSFLIKIDDFKKKRFAILRNEEETLIQEKKEIDQSSTRWVN